MCAIYIGFDVGIRNLAYCIIEKNDNSNLDIIDLENVDLKDYCDKNIKNSQNIIDSVINLLDDLFYNKIKNICNKEIIVLIESQMTSIMKTIQTTINVYFKLISKYHSLNIKTKYVGAKEKLKLTSKFEDYIIPIPTSNNKYQQNKLDAVHFTEWLLQNKYNNSNILNKFTSFKKKSDISDAFLTIIQYIEK